MPHRVRRRGARMARKFGARVHYTQSTRSGVHMVKLGEFVARKFNVPIEKVMLLRHSNVRIKQIKERGATVKQYTQVQPMDTKYDYFRKGHEKIELVVVLVDDKVDAIFRVKGIEKQGTNYSLNSPELVEADQRGRRKERKSRLFSLEEIHDDSLLGRQTQGWERRQRTPVQRSNDKFYDEITVDVPRTDGVDALPTIDAVRLELENQVKKASQDSSETRRKRLATAERKPKRVEVLAVAFIRNADVITEVRTRAGGKCELCGKPAPFVKKADGKPYLEVHHRVRLADGGDDTVENAIAVCPNCHRREHFGK